MNCHKPNYQTACSQVHALVTDLTQDISPEKIKHAGLVRKRMSALTFGICTAVAEQTALDNTELYFCYLLKGGLKTHQARVVVERTSLEFIEQSYAKGCFQVGYKLVNNNPPLEKINLQEISELLIQE